MRKFSPLRRRAKQAGVVACGLVLVVMGIASPWIMDSAKGPPAIQMIGLVVGWFALMAGPVVGALLLLRDWHEGDITPHCRNCDYDLTGNVTGRCPECGTPIPYGDLTLSGRPALFRNPFEVLADALSGRSGSTKALVIYLVYLLLFCYVVFCITHPLLRSGCR